MIFKNNISGCSLIRQFVKDLSINLVVIFLVAFIIHFIFSLFDSNEDVSNNKKEKVTVAHSKFEPLQPVVTEFKNYSNQPYVSDSKLMPILNPEMRKEPILPVAPVEKIEKPVPQPIIEKNENHYHFEDLNSGITYLASSLLGIFVAICFYKGFGKFSQNLSVKRAIKKSNLLLDAFEADINNESRYLDYTRVITDQLRFNNTIMEQNKNSYHIPVLSVVNDKLVANLNFAENSLVNDMKR